MFALGETNTNQYLGRREWQDVWEYTTYKCCGNQCISNLYLNPNRVWNFEFGRWREQRATGILEALKASKFLAGSDSKKSEGSAANTSVAEPVPVSLRNTCKYSPPEEEEFILRNS